MNSPKLSFFQYQILENLYKGVNNFNKDKRYYSAVNKLKDNNLIKKRPLILTEDGLNLTKDFYKFRHFLPKYKGEILDLKINTDFGYFNQSNFIASLEGKISEEIIKNYKKSNKFLLLDPFCGTGIINVCAKVLGFKSIGFEVNPLMIWENKNKFNCTISTEELIMCYEKLVIEFVKISEKEKKALMLKSKLKLMGDKELNKWLSPVNQKEFAALNVLILEIKNKEIRGLLRTHLINALESVSNVRFCPGISFLGIENKKKLLMEFKQSLEKWISDFNYEAVNKNKKTEINFFLKSAIDSNSYKNLKGKVDLIVSSPPYPNNIDYVANSKLALYASNLAKSKKDLQEIRSKMLISNPKSNFKKIVFSDSLKKIDLLFNTLTLLEKQTENKSWGFDYVKMIEGYFSEMYLVLNNCYNTLVKSGYCIFIVSDQTAQGIKIKTGEILAEIAKLIGYKKILVKNYKIRKTSSYNKFLEERVLILRK